MRRRGGGLRTYVGARLQRKLFLALGVAILCAGVAAAMVMHATGSPWPEERERIARFVTGRFSRVWDRPDERQELARALQKDFSVSLRLRDVSGSVLLEEGPWTRGCRWIEQAPVWHSPGQRSGTVELCLDGYGVGRRGWRSPLVLFAVASVLWAVAGLVARSLAWPLVQLTRVTREMGAGNLQCRARMCHTPSDEVGELALSINELAGRIERQLRDQRELLAAVSHELRTPLARIRLLLEFARDGAGHPDPLGEIERETEEMDALVGDLLASARIDFSALKLKALAVDEAAMRAAERANLDPMRVRFEGAPGAMKADPTLVTRALIAMVDNANKYGNGTAELLVEGDGSRVRFVVLDRGPGFAPGEEERAFESFYRSDSAKTGDIPGIGLGLSLVRRIAEAHGGRAIASNRTGGGAEVVLELPRGGPGSLPAEESVLP